MTPLLTLPAAAALLSLSPATLRRWCSTGRVAHRKVGGAIRFTEQDVEAIVRESYRGVREEREPRAINQPILWGRTEAERARLRRASVPSKGARNA